jgi:hypothetical protein
MTKTNQVARCVVERRLVDVVSWSCPSCGCDSVSSHGVLIKHLVGGGTESVVCVHNGCGCEYDIKLSVDNV